jgi:hypothetical protein
LKPTTSELVSTSTENSPVDSKVTFVNPAEGVNSAVVVVVVVVIVKSEVFTAVFGLNPSALELQSPQFDRDDI